MQQTSVVLDDSSHAELYRRTAPALLAYLLRQVASREDAEDLLLEVFLAALENEQFSTIPEGKQQAWLRMVARNKVVDYYRRTQRRPSIPLLQMAENIYSREELEPEQVALRHEEYSHLYRTMQGLSQSQQEILQLRFGHGLSCNEIATVMEKSEGAVRMLLSRTLKLLRGLYTKHAS
jgi:RNA polymerase sigma-70 factor (ECF subfamily)